MLKKNPWLPGIAALVILAGSVSTAAVAAVTPEWTVDDSALPANYEAGNLNDVDCPSDDSCQAVGHFSSLSAGNPVTPLIKSWNGTTWSVAASGPLPSDYVNSAGLNAVTCVEDDACQAVGSYVTTGANNPQFPMVQAWDGAQWTVTASSQSSLPPDFYTGWLADVACGSATSCQAVGAYQATDNLTYLLIMTTHDGAAWTSTVPMPADYSGDGNLTSVTCASALSCQAVGYYASIRPGQPYVPVFLRTMDAGLTWSLPLTTYPADADSSTAVSDVDCGSVTSCHAVGQYTDIHVVYRTLIYTYDGTSWTPVVATDPVDLGTQATLYRIDCASATSCKAAGYYKDDQGALRALVESWDGTQWSVTTLPSAIAGRLLLLTAVSCSSAISCVAVGSEGVGTSAAFAMTLSGTTWSAATLPGPVDQGSYSILVDASCPSDATCQAIGIYTRAGAGSPAFPLIESYQRPAAPASPPASTSASGSSSTPRSAAAQARNSASPTAAATPTARPTPKPSSAGAGDPSPTVTSEPNAVTKPVVQPGLDWWWLVILLGGLAVIAILALTIRWRIRARS